MRVALALIAVWCATARADDSFEARAAGAERVHRFENVVWALTATCEAGDDTHQRQCRHVRNARQAELAGRTLLVDADDEAFDIGAWNPATKTIPFTLSACIRCLGVELDGKTWYVIGSGVPAHFQGNLLTVGALHTETRAFADQAAATAWARAVGNAHVELVVKVPPRLHPTDPSKPIELDIVAWRVVAPCDGAILAASPPSTALPGDKQQCIPPAKAAAGPELAELTADAIRTAMEPVVEAARVCFGKLAVTGTAHLALRVLPDGTVGRYAQRGDFVNTPTGACIDRAAAKLTFPPSKHGISIDFPLVVKP